MLTNSRKPRNARVGTAFLPVRVLRDKLGISQESFAYLLGFTRVTVNRWESGGGLVTGLGAVVLALLASVLRRHEPDHVVATIQRAVEADEELPGTCGRSLTVVRALVELESTSPSSPRGRHPRTVE